MIISKTPFRISFFGGGTDLPAWYQHNGGQVLSTAINKYCYISCRYLPPFFEHKYRLVYSLIENVQHYSEIQHPAARAILEYLQCGQGLEIHHDGDLPAQAGLGSSSSFTVGLLNSIYALDGVYKSAAELGREAIHVEQDLIRENVGSQDQLAVAHGGLNHIHFNHDGSHDLRPLIIASDKQQRLENNLMLYFTGLSRFSSEIEREKISNIKRRERELRNIHRHVDDAIAILGSSAGDLDDFGLLLDETWKNKRALSSGVSNNEIDDIYAAAIRAGALGGKLLGAGGGGFILFYVPTGRRQALRDALARLIHVPFQFEREGSRIVYYRPGRIE